MSKVTRRDTIKLAAAGAVLAALVVGVMTTYAQDEKLPTTVGQEWDCIVNKTGKNVLITLASGNAGGPGYYLPKNGKLEFQVRKTTKKMAYVAYEFGTDSLVKMEEFTVVHQPYPPTNCLHITATAADRHKDAASASRTSPPAVPLPY